MNKKPIGAHHARSKGRALAVARIRVNATSLPAVDEVIIRKFWSRVVIGDPRQCWECLGVCVGKGYGQFAMDHGIYKIRARAHRFAWRITYGAIPDGLLVCHNCDNPKCCNPRHLFLGTPSDNMQDMVGKGRHRSTPRRPGLAGRKLTDDQVRHVRKMLVAGTAAEDLSRQLNISTRTVWDIAKGRTWKKLS